MLNSFIPSVNYHVWEPCNMRCKFCFATFQDVKHSILPKGHLPKEQAIELVKLLAAFGFQKITFAGGEPTLCPWLSELIAIAKDAGMTTMIITNGSHLTDEFLDTNRNKLDWIGISIDSLNPDTNLQIGRAITGKTPLSLECYKSLINRIKEFDYGLKINTVVNSKNYLENMIDFIRFAQPKRWKIMQVLPIIGQNDVSIEDYIITEKEFQIFLDKHSVLSDITQLVPESNTLMKGSYAMIDPAGRFFDNAAGTHKYSTPILDIGIEMAIQEVTYDLSKFISRGGLYDWETK